jgi:hypothetical protein
MTVPGAGRKVTGAGFALIGLIVWAAAAVGPLVAHPRSHSSEFHSAGCEP